MPDSVLVELSPVRPRVEPGGAPAEMIITLQNLGDSVQHYTVDVVGLDPLWYTIAGAGDGVGLFPKDRDQVRLSFHPPAGPGLRAGAYPFEVRVRSRDGTQQSAAAAVLDVRGEPAFRLDLMPLRQTAKGRGKFTIQVSNTGTADGQLTFEASDAEEACRFAFPRGDSIGVPARGKVDVPFFVIPRKRPWVGQERTYDFTIKGKSQTARRIVQPFPGQYTYQPPVRSFGPFVRFLMGLGAAGAAALILLVMWGQVAATSQEFVRRYCTLAGGVPALYSRWPCHGEGSGPCHFRFYNREFHRADPQLIGNCTTNEVADAQGNTRQYTENGVLLWLKGGQISYFFTKDKLYVFDNGQVRLLDSPELH